MEKLIQIPKSDFKTTITYLYTLHQMIEKIKKQPGISRKKIKELHTQTDKLAAFIEKYEDQVFK